MSNPWVGYFFSYDINCGELLILIFEYKVVQIWPGLIVCKQVTVCPGDIWTTLYTVLPHFLVVEGSAIKYGTLINLVGLSYDEDYTRMKKVTLPSGSCCETQSWNGTNWIKNEVRRSALLLKEDEAADVSKK
jgi:hypothetical protein